MPPEKYGNVEYDRFDRNFRNILGNVVSSDLEEHEITAYTDAAFSILEAYEEHFGLDRSGNHLLDAAELADLDPLDPTHGAIIDATYHYLDKFIADLDDF